MVDILSFYDDDRFIDYYDMSSYRHRRHISLLNCIKAIDAAESLRIFDPKDFDVDEYDYYYVSISFLPSRFYHPVTSALKEYFSLYK